MKLDVAPVSAPYGSVSRAITSVTIAALLAGCGAIGTLRPSPTTGPATPSQPTPSAQPSPTVTPAATTRATTPSVAPWLRLTWSDGVTLPGSPPTGDPSPLEHISDVLPWRGGYVAVGNVQEGGTQAAAFFTSPNGLDWRLTDRVTTSLPLPEYVVPVRDGLLAFGSPYGSTDLWWSVDGKTWTSLDSPTWQAVWTDLAEGFPVQQSVLAAAAGPSGIVAVGLAEAKRSAPFIVYSIDGRTWQRLNLPPVFDHAFFQDVAAFPGGFVIAGRVDQQVTATPDPGAYKGMPFSMPAAWTSSDGVTWTACAVEARSDQGAQLDRVLVGAGGLVVFGTPSWRGEAARWTSGDGRTWQLADGMGWENDGPVLASDGTRMTALVGGPSQGALNGWVSSDGAAWDPLEMSGAAASLLEHGVGAGLSGWRQSASQAWLGPDRLIVTAWNTYYSNQEFWLGSPGLVGQP
jgi:hypothetical protein